MCNPHDAFWVMNARIRIAENFSQMFLLTISTAIMQPHKGKYHDAQRNYRIAPFGYIHCCTVDTPKHWLDTAHMHITPYSQFNSVKLHCDS